MTKVKRKKSGKSKTVKKTAISKSPSILLIGEERLVEELGSVLSSSGQHFHSLITSEHQNIFVRASIAKSLKSLSSSISLAFELTVVPSDVKKNNLEDLDSFLSPDIPIISAASAITVSEQATWINRKNRLIGIALIPGFLSKTLYEFAPTVHTDTQTVEKVEALIQQIGKEIIFVQDRIGMVFPRLICRIINEAFFACEEDITHPRSIDFASRLVLQMDQGPIALAEKIGFKDVVTILSAIHKETGEPRYRVSQLLRQLSRTGKWWKEENSERKEK